MAFIIRKTLSEIFLERVRSAPSDVGFQFKPTHIDEGPVGKWKEVTFKEFYQECRIISYGLMALGVEPGNRVVILSNTRYEWSLSDMSILGASGVTVPIYASNTSADIAYVIQHAGAQIAIVENAEQFKKIIEKIENLPFLKKIILIESSAMALVGRDAVWGQKVLTFQEIGRAHV